MFLDAAYSYTDELETGQPQSTPINPNRQNHIMSFSDLSRELRNIIYKELLCPPNGVYLHHDSHRWVRMAWFTSYGYSDSDVDEDGDLDEGKEKKGDERGGHRKGADRWGNSDSAASAAIPVPTAIFYVSHQFRQEASEVFYGFNRFTFDTNIRTALKFLKCLRPSFRRYIKNIGFTAMSTATKNDDCGELWKHLSNFLTRGMSLNSVTVQVPQHNRYRMDYTSNFNWTLDSDCCWWPASQLMTALLMAGNIKQLRISYSATLAINDSEEETQHQEAEKSQHKDPLEKLDSISYLRYPYRNEERKRERLERQDLKSALDEERPHKFSSLGALLADQYTRRQRLNFVLTRTDDPIGDIGTVLVLTRPTERRRCALD